MDRPILIFEYSPLLLLLCMLLALGISWLFYLYGKNTWGRKVNTFLFSIRTVLVFILSALLISPILKYLQNQVERPVVVLAVDNSVSVDEVTDSTQLIAHLQDLETGLSEIEERGYSTRILSYDGEVTDLATLGFENRSSNLSGLLRKIEDQFDGRNLHSVILLSDGIYNSGASPAYRNYSFDLYTIAMGDTLARNDLSVQDVQHNRISYQGNQFPIRAKVMNEGFEGQASNVNLWYNGRLLESRRVEFRDNHDLQNVEFLVDATEAGTQRYTVTLDVLEGEYTHENNRQSVFIDIVEGRENVLLISERPHPDIRVLKEAVESNSNYSFTTYIRGISELPERETRFDMVICHQCTGDENFIQALEIDLSNIPMWVIYGRQMPVSSIDRTETVKIEYLPGEYDNVTPAFNTAFSSFDLSDELRQLMADFPPLIVPFGDISMEYDVEALLFQRVGNIETTKPLMVIGESEPRKAVMLGEGIWRWKLHDHLRNDNSDLFKEFVSKVVQYLSTRQDRNKLRVYPVNSETTDQSVVLETEAYNDLFERIYDVPVSLRVRNEEGEVTEFNYVVGTGNSRYRINGLKPGVYTYSASASIGENTETSAGQFVIRELQVEYVNLTADHGLLRRLASENNGLMIMPGNSDQLLNALTEENAKGIIHSFESYDPLINLPWILVILVILVSVEWFTRKYFGIY